LSINIKKKTVNIMIAVVVIAIVIGVGIFIANIVITNVKIKEIEQKLSAINSEELQGKIEEELKKTKLFMEMDLDNLYVGSMINDGIEHEGYKCVSILCLKGGNIVGLVEVPCFKITSDSNGKFKNIEYTDFLFSETQVVKEAVEKVFENDYGIDFGEINKNKTIRNRFYKDGFNFTNTGEVYIMDENFFVAVLHNVANMNLEYGDNVTKDMKEFKTKTFGVEF